MLLTWLTDGDLWITTPNRHNHRFVITEYAAEAPWTTLFTLEDRKFGGPRLHRGTVVRRQNGLRSLRDAVDLAEDWDDERYEDLARGHQPRRRHGRAPRIVEESR